LSQVFRGYEIVENDSHHIVWGQVHLGCWVQWDKVEIWGRGIGGIVKNYEVAIDKKFDRRGLAEIRNPSDKLIALCYIDGLEDITRAYPRSLFKPEVVFKRFSLGLELPDSIPHCCIDVSGACGEALGSSSVSLGRVRVDVGGIYEFSCLPSGLSGILIEYVNLDDSGTSIEQRSECYENTTENQGFVMESGLFPSLPNGHLKRLIELVGAFTCSCFLVLATVYSDGNALQFLCSVVLIFLGMICFSIIFFDGLLA
jgi:hypothetical protein